jgi:hypothetical protein
MRQLERVMQVIKETLGSLASQERVTELLTRALARFGLDEVPTATDELEVWVRGPLRDVLDEELGATAAELLAADLGILSQRTGSNHQAREQLVQTARTELTAKQRALIDATRDKKSDPTLRIALPKPSVASQDDRSRVLVVTDDSSLLEQLRRELVAAAEVSPLVQVQGEHGALTNGSRCVVLIDTDSALAQRMTPEQLGRALPARATVVVWGASPESWRDFELESSSTYRWVRCTKEASADDLVPLCRMVLSKSNT